MADPAIVQSVLTPGDASVSLPTNFASLPSVGNYVVVAVSSGSGTNPAGALVDDNQGHTYTKQKTNSDSNSGTTQLWWAKVATSAGTFTVNAKVMGSGNCQAAVMEFSNVHASSPIIDSNSAFVTTFTATMATGGTMASPQINAYMLHLLIPAATGQTYTSRGDLTTIYSSNTVGTGQVIALGGGKIKAHGPNLVGQIGLSSGDAYTSVSMILRGTDPVVTGPGGGPFDDRYRFRASQGATVGASGTVRTLRAVWPPDALDNGVSDSIDDNPSWNF